VFSLSGSLYLSEDGGANFRTIARDVHGDHQAMWIDPTNPKYILSGSDGGWQVSYERRKNFEVVNTFPFTQFLSHQLRPPAAVHGVRRTPGQRQLVRTEPSAVRPRSPQERLVHRIRRRRFSLPCR